MKNKVNCFLLLVFICCIQVRLQAQNTNNIIDSLLTVLITARDDSNKVNLLNDLTWRFRTIGKYEKAFDYGMQARSLANSIKYKRGEGRAYGNMGLLLADQGKYPEAKQSHKNALALREIIGDRAGAGNSYTNLGHLFYDEGAFDSAVYLYKKCLKIREELSDQQGLADCYNNIGNVYQSQGNYAEALNYHLGALDIRKRVKDNQGIADSYGNIGLVFKDQGNYHEALQNYFSSLKLADAMGSKSTKAHALGNIGNVYALQGNLSEALKYQLASLKIKEEMGHKRSISISCDNIGVLYARLENFPEAIRNFQQAKRINEEIGDKYGQVYNLTNFGGVYIEEAGILLKKSSSNSEVQEKLDKAMEYFKNALKISQEIGNKKGEAMSYFNLGLTFNKKGNYSEALRNNSLALKHFGSINDKYGIAKAHSVFGNILIKMAEKDNSKKYNENIWQNLDKGLQIGREIGSKEIIRDIYENYSKLYEITRDYKQALNYSNLFFAMKDSIINKESVQKMEGLRLQYEIEKVQVHEQARSEREKEQLQFAYAKREDSLRFQQLITQEQLKQQTLLGKQQEQAMLLQQASLNISNQQSELNRLAFLKTQAELEAEQSKRQEKENQLMLVEKESALQASQLKLQETDLNLKESQLQAQKKQQLFYIGGITLLLLLSFLIFRNIKSRQKANLVIAAEKLKVEKAEASHKMAELELQSLRTQLNPHFMFNSLNAIQELILMEDNENSHLYLSRFSELLRTLLDNANQPFIPLKKEIDFLNLYLSLENLRIPDLQYSIQVEPGIQPGIVMIPNMMLQPYIENAIWHGLSHKKNNRKLDIRIRQNENGSGILFEIEDNGVGRKRAAELRSLYRKEHRSKGMELLSKRFSLLSKEYGASIQTDIVDLVDGEKEGAGTFVSITVPYSLTEKSLQPLYDKSYHN